MPNVPRSRAPWYFWVVGTVSLFWNSGGPIDYVMTKMHNATYLAAATPEQRAYFDHFPIWMEAAWALGVWCAVGGSILLLLRSALAVPVFAISLAGLAVSTVYRYGSADTPAAFKASGAIAFDIALWAVAIALLWFALRMRARGVLR